MQFRHTPHIDKRPAADALVLPFWKGDQGPEKAFPWPEAIAERLRLPLSTGDFQGKAGDVLYLYVADAPEQRWILLGLGEEGRLEAETLRGCYGSLAKSCLGKRWRCLNVLVPKSRKIKAPEIEGVIEGLLLPNYLLKSFKQKEPGEPEERLLEQINWIANREELLASAQRLAAISEGVYYARDLVNGNADEVTPAYLASCAKQMAAQHPAIRTTVFDKKRLEKEGFQLLLAVSRGAAVDPALIIMAYQGNPDTDDHTVMVGKGVTYDTGGLNLKPTGSMETMKCDMAGGAACFGTILSASLLRLPVNLTVVVPATENAIDANSFKPGDVYSSYAGKTVEMTNSDAEGRLILADALSYAVQHLKPTRLIDLATLTGAIEVALGSEAAGLMSTDDVLADQLIAAGHHVAERVWRMPLFDEYKERLKSDVADLKSWNGRAAGANVAALFLRQFVDAVPWAHIDIASTAYLSEAKKYVPKYATGFGVRLMIRFLEQLK